MKLMLLLFSIFSCTLLAVQSRMRCWVLAKSKRINKPYTEVNAEREVIATGLEAPLSEVGLSLAQILPTNADGVVTRINKDRHNPYADAISDFTGIACEPSQGGKLLVYSACKGSGCGEGFQFHILSMQTGQLIAPMHGKSCDAQCAARVLSSALPLRIQAIHQ